MYPAYRWTESYPHHTSPMHYANPSHMKMDPSNLSLPYQPWPYGGNHYHTVPHEYHNCCNHGCFGGCPYSYRPPYSHYPPPPTPPSYGFYPPFPGAYPGYSIPPPHYSIEQPRYDYDKNNHVPRHCGGCNHREDEKKLRIEEEEPEVDKKTSNSLVPVLLKDYPYPIMWVPPGYMDTESKAKEKEKPSHDPVLLKPLESLEKGGNSETTQEQQGDQDRNRFHFPIFWFPYKNNEVGNDSKENDHNLVAHKELPSFRDDDDKKPTRKTDEGLGSEVQSDMGRKFAVQKVIPVKQLGTDEEKKSPTETKAKSSVDKTDTGMEGKHSPRSSKLPPVCLRIDPLPKKKKTSRSPSPPADKGRSNESPADNSKSSHQKTQSSEGFKKSKEDQTKGNIKTTEVTNNANKIENYSLANLCENVLRDLEIKDQCEGKESIKETMQGLAEDSESSQQKTQLSEGLKKSKEEQPKGNIKTIKVINDANKLEGDSLADLYENVQKYLEIKDQGERKESECEKEMMQDQSGNCESCKAEKKILSEHEAALIIQSVYRGFEVRKSQPLMKLRQIAVVNKQVVELRNRIRDLESSTSTICIDDKQKLVIGETIMSLLLKLDTIQGLHPVVRDVRKSVAKELVGLQEKLDSLTSVKAETQSEGVHPLDDTADHEKSDQAQVQSDGNVKHLDCSSGLPENHVVEPTSVCDQSTKELNQLQVSNDQPVDDAVQDMFEQTQARSDSNDLDSDIFENHEVESTDSEHGTHVITPEQQVEPSMEKLNNNQLHVSDEIQEKSDQAQAESGSRVEAAGSQDDSGAEVCDMTDINLEPPVDLKNQQSSRALANNQQEMPEIDQPVNHENFDQGRSQFESSDVERVVSSGYPEVKAEESGEDGNMQNCYNEHIEVVGSAEMEKDVSTVDRVEAKADLHPEEAVNGIQEDLTVSTEEAPKVDDDVESSTEASMEKEKDSKTQIENMDSDHKVDSEESRMEVGIISREEAHPISPIPIGGDEKKVTKEEEKDSKTEIESMDCEKVKKREETRIASTEEEEEEEEGRWIRIAGDERKKKVTEEENEKLRMAVEELMKAGNEQVKVIKELTGRVKDLEKKLKKKKIKVNKLVA